MKIKEIRGKKAQEEMVGFAMIIIIVAIILLILLGISLNKPKTSAVESYEVESFIQALLQHTTECSMNFGVSYNDIGDLIPECDFEQFCGEEPNEVPACLILNTTLKDILEEAWKTGEDRPVKGYALNITTDGDKMLSINKGNVTSNYKAGIQVIPKRGTAYSVEFRVYY